MIFAKFKKQAFGSIFQLQNRSPNSFLAYCLKADFHQCLSNNSYKLNTSSKPFKKSFIPKCKFNNNKSLSLCLFNRVPKPYQYLFRSIIYYQRRSSCILYCNILQIFYCRHSTMLLYKLLSYREQKNLDYFYYEP